MAPHGVSELGMRSKRSQPHYPCLGRCSEILQVQLRPITLHTMMVGCPMSLCIWCMHQCSVKMPSTDHCAAICVGNAMSTSIWEDYCQSLLMTLVLTLHSPPFTFVVMTNCNDGSCGGPTTSTAVDYQSKSGRVITNGLWWLYVVMIAGLYWIDYWYAVERCSYPDVKL